MSVPDLLRDLARVGCSVLIEGDRIELLGAFPDDLLAHAKARRPCIRAVLLGGLAEGRGPLFGPDDLDELANEVAEQDQEILNRRWVIVRPNDYSDRRDERNAPEDRPCYASGGSEGAEATKGRSASEGLYVPATGALAQSRVESNRRKADQWQD